MQNSISSRLNSSRLLFCGVSLGLLSAGVHAQSAPRAALLVVNQGDSNVSIVDSGTGTPGTAAPGTGNSGTAASGAARQVGTIAENTPGMHGHEIAVSLDGRTAYLPIYGSTGVGKPGLSGRTMLVLDVQSQKIAGQVDFGHEVRPHLPVVDPVSGLLYVTTELDKTVTVIDPRTLKIVGAIPTGQAESHMLALSHDGRRGYTANVGPGTVSVLDMVGRKTLAVIPVSGNTQRISISNDDTLVFTADQTKPELAVIDTKSNKVKSWVALPAAGYGTASTKNGQSLLVAVPAAKVVAVVDLASLKVVRTIPVPAAPQEILVRPDGKIAYVSCNQSGQVAAIDLSQQDPQQWKVQALIATGKLADGLAWAK